MLATLVGLSMLLALVGGTATLVGCCWPVGGGPATPAGILRRLPCGSTPARGGGWRPSGRCSPRPSAWATGTSGPANTASQQPSSSPTTRASPPPSRPSPRGLADYQRAAGYLADTWGCVTVRAEQQGPGLIRLRGLHRDPLLLPARVDLSGMAPESLDSWWLGWAEDSTPVFVRLAEVSGIVVAGLAGFGKTMLVGHLLGQLAPSPAVQFVLIDGKGGPDYDRLVPRAWLSAKDDLDRGPRRAPAGPSADGRPPSQHRPGPRGHRRLAPGPVAVLAAGRGRDRRGPYVLPRAQGHLTGGQGPQRRGRRAVAAGRGADPKGRNVAIQVMLLTQRATGDAIPTRIRDNCQVAISFATRTVDGAVAALGEEIRQHPDASPVLLNDPAYVGVAVTSLPGRPGFHRVRTPLVDHHHVAAVIRATAGLRADPAGLLAKQAPGLRVVPSMPASGDVA